MKCTGVEFCDIRIRNGNAQSLTKAFHSQPAGEFRLKERNFIHDKIIFSHILWQALPQG
jgi:hypothetical protein